MRIIVAHNSYQMPGGEDHVFRSEVDILRSEGHDVWEYTDANARIPTVSRLSLALGTIWSRSSYVKLAAMVRQTGARIVHFHNTFPLLSPSCYYAAKGEGAAVIQTLHNYRLICPNGLFYREGHACEGCAGRAIPWPSVVHRCYRNSRAATSAVAAMVAVHRLAGTWAKAVDAFIALTRFARQKFIENGIPESRIYVKPNGLVDDPGFSLEREAFGLFVGRLSEEKGLVPLVCALRQLNDKVPLKIVGSGPMWPWLREHVASLDNVELREHMPRESLWALMKRARFLVVPSTCYEGVPGVIIEAFASGCPVIVSNIGGLASVVEDQRTGLHAIPGDSDSLASRMMLLISTPSLQLEIAKAARKVFEENYTAGVTYQRLMAIYNAALRNSVGDSRGDVLSPLARCPRRLEVDSFCSPETSERERS